MLSCLIFETVNNKDKPFITSKEGYEIIFRKIALRMHKLNLPKFTGTSILLTN